jgi:membrane protease YdiL (CAAX protease family)
MIEKKSISTIKGVVIFSIFIVYIHVLLYFIYPIIRNNFPIYNLIFYWFIIGYLLFLPISLLAIIFVKLEGNKNIVNIFQALNVKKLTKTDIKYCVIGLFFLIISSGIIFFGSILLNKIFGVRLLNTNVWFMEIPPLTWSQKIITLLIWFPMFILNIFGEEILWRGYIQSRTKVNWIIWSVLWLLLHLPFGIDFIILLLPIVLIIPYIFNKQKNTLIGCIIHGLFNGIAFVLMVLGIV